MFHVERASFLHLVTTNAGRAPKRMEIAWAMRVMTLVDADTTTESFYKNYRAACLLKYVNCDTAN